MNDPSSLLSEIGIVFAPLPRPRSELQPYGAKDDDE